MSEVTSTVLDIIKTTVPALVVFGTVYYLFKKYNDQQYALKALEYNTKFNDTTLPMKLQAYERLVLFCERINPENMFLRLNAGDPTPQSMAASMLITIQQELDYNLTQQLYVGNNLWKIIMLAKDQTAEIISQAAETTSKEDSVQVFMDKVRYYKHKLLEDPLEVAKFAIKKEVESIIK